MTHPLDGKIFTRTDYVVMSGGFVVWPDPVRATTKQEAEAAALGIKGGVVMPCQVYSYPNKCGGGEPQETAFAQVQLLGRPEPLFIPVK
jgi:ABC-type polar amino acid transport system ATPase subunit